ncbi:hypothetical protein MASSI9I_60431 [Massilia sp. 9I]|nr:hypothetical protein MASSI9I_60431 [Massilia sp. 9I]
MPRAAVRLACVKHAASVQSEPGSNSSVQSLFVGIAAIGIATESLTQDTDRHPIAGTTLNTFVNI